jgi:acetylglutamate kinase
MTKVIKLGGSLLDDPARRSRALDVIVSAWNRGESLVLVHGGGKHVDATLAKLGIPKRTHAGLRITDDITLDVVVSVLGGTVNKMLVGELSARGLRAAGISGCDGGTLVATRHEPIDGVDLGHVGRVTGSSKTLLQSMLTYGMMPVVSTVALGPNGSLLNVNADSGAAAIAIALGASTLHFITDVPGLMGSDGTVVPTLTPRDAHALLANGVVSGGMRPKLEAALNALESGVGSVSIGEEGGTHLVAA